MLDLSLIDGAAGATMASPWVSEFKKLSTIHFNSSILRDLKEINNTFATIFSGALYFYVSYSNPDNLIRMWPWYVFIILAFISFRNSSVPFSKKVNFF